MTQELELPVKTTHKTILPFVSQPIEMGSIQAELDAFKADCMTIVVSSPDDKAGRDLAYSNRQKVKNTRIAFEKSIDASLVQPKAFIKEVTELVKSLVTEFKLVEEHLASQEKIVNDAIEAAKRQKEQEEADRIASRINALNLLGAKYENNQYEVFGVFIDSIEVTALPDDEFRELLDSATTAYNAEQTRLAAIETERVAEVARVAAEQQRIADEQETERVRLQALADENRRIASEQAQRQNELDQKLAEFEQKQRQAEQDEVDRLEAIQAERWKMRLECIAEAGGKFIDNGSSAGYGECWAPTANLKTCDNQTFASFITGINEAVAKAKADDAAKIKQDAIDEAARIKAEKQAEIEQKRADKERQARLKPDVKALTKYFHGFTVAGAGKLEQPETAQVFMDFAERIVGVVKLAIDELDAL